MKLHPVTLLLFPSYATAQNYWAGPGSGGGEPTMKSNGCSWNGTIGKKFLLEVTNCDTGTFQMENPGIIEDYAELRIPADSGVTKLVFGGLFDNATIIAPGVKESLSDSSITKSNLLRDGGCINLAKDATANNTDGGDGFVPFNVNNKITIVEGVDASCPDMAPPADYDLSYLYLWCGPFNLYRHVSYHGICDHSKQTLTNECNLQISDCPSYKIGIIENLATLTFMDDKVTKFKFGTLTNECKVNACKSTNLEVEGILLTNQAKLKTGPGATFDIGTIDNLARKKTFSSYEECTSSGIHKTYKATVMTTGLVLALLAM